MTVYHPEYLVLAGLSVVLFFGAMQILWAIERSNINGPLLKISTEDVALGVKLLREQIHLDSLFLAEPIHQRKHMHLCIERERRIRGFTTILKLLGERYDQK